jgi:hypothetical protein
MPSCRPTDTRTTAFGSAIRTQGFYLFNMLGICCFLTILGGCQRESRLSLVPVFADLGEVGARDEIFHEFTLTNSGNSPIVIDAVTPSCPCISLETLSGDPDTPLLPSKAVVIRAKTTVGGFSDIVQGTVGIRYTDSGLNVVHALTTSFQARLRTDYELDTTDIDFGDLEISRAAPYSRTIRLRANEQGIQHVVIRDAKATTSALEFTRIEPEFVEFRIRCDDNMLARKYRESIQIRTSSPYRPIMTVPVRWRVCKEVDVTPIVLTSKSGEFVTKTLSIATAKPSKLVDIRLPAGCKIDKPCSDITTMKRTHTLKVILCSDATASREEDANNSANAVNVRLEGEDGKSIVAHVPVYFFN